MLTRRGFVLTASGAAAALCRAQTQPPMQMAMHMTPSFEEIAAALEVKAGSSVADVGAGMGPYTFKLAQLVGSEGRVWAVDIAKSAIRQLQRKVADDNLVNVLVVRGRSDDPLLPAARLDGILVVDAYHEMEEHAAMLSRMRESLKPNGRIVIVEHTPQEALLAKPRQDQEDRHALAARFVEDDLKQAGFDLLNTTQPRSDGHMGRYMVVARLKSS